VTWSEEQLDCDVLLISNKLIFSFFALQDSGRLLDLNMVIAKIFFELNEWMCLPPNLLEKFLEFFENALLGKV